MLVNMCINRHANIMHVDMFVNILVNMHLNMLVNKSVNILLNIPVNMSRFTGKPR